MVESFENIIYPMFTPSSDPTNSLGFYNPTAPPLPEGLEEDFTMVPQLTPIISLSSMDSINQPPAESVVDEEEEEEECASVANSDSSEFEIVIPECFKLEVPLPGFEQPSITDEDEEQQQGGGEQEEEEERSCVTPPSEFVPEPILDLTANSPSRARREFKPDRVTLQRVWSRKSHDPMRYAIGLVNTVSDIVEKHVKLGPPVDDPKEAEEVSV